MIFTLNNQNRAFIANKPWKRTSEEVLICAADFYVVRQLAVIGCLGVSTPGLHTTL